MRKLLILAVVACLTGCQGTGLFASRQKDKDRDRSSRISSPDPLLSPDIEEQKRWDRARYSYPEHNPLIAPNTYSDRPTPSGR